MLRDTRDTSLNISQIFPASCLLLFTRVYIIAIRFIRRTIFHFPVFRIPVPSVVRETLHLSLNVFGYLEDVYAHCLIYILTTQHGKSAEIIK